MDLVKKFFQFWQPKKTYSASGLIYGLNSTSGELVTVDTALTEATVYSCIRLITTNIASLPLNPYEKTSNGRKKLDQSKVYQLVANSPNPSMTAMDWKMGTIGQMIAYGNSFTFVDYLGDHPISMWLLNPGEVKVMQDSNGFPIYTYQNKQFTHKEVLHFKNFSLDGVMGLSTIEVHKNKVGSSLAARKYTGNLYKNSATPSGILKFPGQLSPEAKKRLQTSFEDSYQGASNSGKTLLLEDGLDFHPLSLKPADLEYIQTMRFNGLEICGMFGVPAHMLNLNDKPAYASVEQMAIEFLNYTIRPYLVSVENTLNQHFFTNDNTKYFQFNTNALMRTDMKTRFECYHMGLTDGWLNINEVREMEDKDTIPEGNKHLYPLNMGILGQSPNEGKKQ